MPGDLPRALPDSDIYGAKLTAAEALEHDCLPAFWEIVDYIAETEPRVKRSLLDNLPVGSAV